MKRDGTKSWVVISRGIERYVTELALDHLEPMRVDNHTVGPGTTSGLDVAPTAPTSSSSKTGAPVPMEQ